MNKIPLRPVGLRVCLIALAGFGLVACGDREAEQRAAAAAEAAAQEQKADELERQYEQARTANDWEMARIHGSALLSQYPQTQAAERITAGLEEVKAKAEDAREQGSMHSHLGDRQGKPSAS